MCLEGMMVSSMKHPSIGKKSKIALAVVCIVALISACIILTVYLAFCRKPPQDFAPKPTFYTGGNMLDYLLSLRQIDRKDGLLVTWYHAANKKSDMEEALKSKSCNVFTLSFRWEIKGQEPLGRDSFEELANVSMSATSVKGDVMVLEADVTIEGHNTKNETNKPIMAHPPDIYSDNSFAEWLEAVLESSNKAIKLDFKSIKSVGPSLDILVKKSSQVNIDRPVWLNADILKGPNVPIDTAINASRFLSLVQEKFPNCTISPGWTALYLPFFSNQTYTKKMVEEMHSLVGKLPQLINFPIRAVLARPAWPQLSWLLSQSHRYSLTLWQGKTDPVTVEDLLFIRNNSHLEQIYYDIYEPVLSKFKDVAFNATRKREDHPGIRSVPT